MVKKYRVRFKPEAIDDMENLDRIIAQRVLNKIRWLQDNFENVIPETLEGEFKECFKLRVGDWRVVYTVDRNEKIITIHLVGHRSKIYRT